MADTQQIHIDYMLFLDCACGEHSSCNISEDQMFVQLLLRKREGHLVLNQGLSNFSELKIFLGCLLMQTPIRELLPEPLAAGPGSVNC